MVRRIYRHKRNDKQVPFYKDIKFIIAALIPLLWILIQFYISIIDPFFNNKLIVQSVPESKFLGDSFTTFKYFSNLYDTRRREYGIMLKNIKKFVVDTVTLGFTLSSKSNENIFLKKIILKVDSVKSLKKYSFPGLYYCRLNHYLGYSITFNVKLSASNDSYIVYDMLKFNRNKYLVYSYKLVPNFILFNLESKPGFKYYIKTVFEYFADENSNKSYLVITPTKEVSFPLIVSYDTFCETNNEFFLYTNTPFAISQILKEFPNSRLHVIYKLDSKGKKLKSYLAKLNLKGLKIYFDLNPLSYSFLIINRKHLLINREEYDPDFKVLNSNFTEGYVVEYINNPSNILKLLTLFLNKIKIYKQRYNKSLNLTEKRGA